MMASIPNMRSTPLPVPATKSAPAGEPAPGGFAVEPPAPVTGPPAAVAPPLQSPTPVEFLEAIVPEIVAPEGDGEGADGDTAAPAKAEKTADEGQAETGALIPFVQPLPVVAGPRVIPAAVEGVPPAPTAATAAEPAGLPCGPIGTGKKGAPAPAGRDLPPDETDAPDLTPEAMTDPVVKALLQRKPPSAKQVVAKPEVTDMARADPAPAKAQPRQAPAPAAPVAVQAVAPLAVAEAPQPALSPSAAQLAPAAAEKADTVEGTRTADLAVERKLDLARDGAWLDRLARDIARAGANDAPLRFRLHPQTLGSLHVELQQGDHGTAVRLTVETEAARQILADAQPRLTAEARAQGVRIAETHVDLSGSGRHAPGDQRRQDEAGQTPLIRTARGAGSEVAQSARPSGRARLDRYA